MAEQAAKILIEAGVPFYQRGGHLVRPIQLEAKSFFEKKPQMISAFGSRRLDRMVEGIRKREQTEDDDDAIKKINETHALVLAGNKAVVV